MAWIERYVSVAGGGAHDGTSEADAWTLAEAIAAPYATGQRINVKAGTYPNTTTNRTLSVAGTATAPIWWRGYNSTPGDLEGVANSANRPQFTFTTGALTLSGANQLFSDIDVTGASMSGGQVATTGAGVWVHRCRIENTAANVNARAVYFTAGNCLLSCCRLKCTSSANIVYTDSDNNCMAGCVLQGGLNGWVITNFVQAIAYKCIWDNTGGDCIQSPGTSCRVFAFGCDFHSAGSDGIDFTAVPATAVVVDCIFNDCLYGIHNSSGANAARMKCLYNLFGPNTSGPSNGFGDWPLLSGQSDASSPFEDAGSGDFTPAEASNALGSGLPGEFEGL